MQHAWLFVLLAALFIYACLLPLVLLEMFVSVYQVVCFPIYAIPKERRRYLGFDRAKLRDLNIAERINFTSFARM